MKSHALSAVVLPFLFLCVPTLAAATLPTAEDFERADAKGIVDLRVSILKTTPVMPVPRASFGASIDKAYSPLLASPNPLVRLNIAILLAQVGSIHTTKTLTAMLSNPDPSVRYWGAKALGEAAETLKRVGPAAEVAALAAAARTESDPIVKKRIRDSLAEF